MDLTHQGCVSGLIQQTHTLIDVLLAGSFVLLIIYWQLIDWLTVLHVEGGTSMSVIQGSRCLTRLWGEHMISEDHIYVSYSIQ